MLMLLVSPWCLAAEVYNIPERADQVRPDTLALSPRPDTIRPYMCFTDYNDIFLPQVNAESPSIEPTFYRD